MFTIKHRDSDANGSVETIYSAETIEVVPPGLYRNADGAKDPASSNWDEAGIFLDREEPAMEGAPRFAKHIILFGGGHSEDARRRMGGKVWVMNEAGATVATYEL